MMFSSSPQLHLTQGERGRTVVKVLTINLINKKNTFLCSLSKKTFRLAEQRRKRVKELEEKISLLNKKVMDQDRIIKMKERNEEKIKTLNKEIMVCLNLALPVYFNTLLKQTK